MPNENAVDVVGILDVLISDPESRRQFYEDPDATLLNAGADPNDAPPAVWAALTGMSLDELSAIAGLGAALAADGFFNAHMAWHHVV